MIAIGIGDEMRDKASNVKIHFACIPDMRIKRKCHDVT